MVLVVSVFINAVDIVVFSIFLVVAFVVVILFFCLSLVSSCRSSLHCYSIREKLFFRNGRQCSSGDDDEAEGESKQRRVDFINVTPEKR